MALGPSGSGQLEGAVPGGLSALLDALARAPASAEGPWSQPLRPGERLEHFDVLREIGRGGFGTVYEAIDLELGRRVALKTLRPRSAALAGRADEVSREAQAAARLSHPGIVTLYEARNCERGPFLVMELLRGETLAERLARGPLAVPEALETGLQAARALAYVHAQGVVHRDLTPHNLFLAEDGRVRLLDLGLANVLGHEPGAAAGTPAYVAPEQWRGEAVDGRADVFSLGAVLYQALTGHHAFEVHDGRSSALDGARPPTLPTGVPRALNALLTRCLAADLAVRPTAAQFAEELLAVQRRLAWPRSRRRLALLTVVGLLVGAGAAGLLVRLALPRAPARGADGRVSVAVADFVNETRDPDLDSLSGLVITSLEQSQKLRVITRTRMFDVLRAAGKEEVERIDEALAREVGRRTNVRALLLATIRKLGDRYVVDVRGVDPHEDEYLFAVRETAERKGDLLALVDRLSERVRALLREEDKEIRATETRVGESVTTSLEAFRHYFRGQQLYDQTRAQEALAEFRQALREDPGFALAHYGVSTALMAVKGPTLERRAHADAAAAAADRLPEKEALLVRVWQARSYGRNDEARALMSQLLDRYPEDKEVTLWAAQMELNLFLATRRARQLYERAFLLDPTSVRAQAGLTTAMLQLGELEEAARFVRDWEAARPSYAATCRLAVVELNRRRLDAALEAARRCAALGPPPDYRPGLETVFWVHLVREELEEAKADVIAYRTSGNPALAAWLGAWNAAGLGRMNDAERLAREATAQAPDYLSVALLAARGPSAALRRASVEYRASFSSHQLQVSIYLGLAGALGPARECWPLHLPPVLLDALDRRQKGDLAGARTALVEIAAAPGDLVPQAAKYALVETCHLTADARCVLDAAEAFRYQTDWDLDTFAWRAWAWPRVLYWSAVAHQRLGETALAREKIGRLLRLWKDADPDLTLLPEARALGRSLGVP